MVQTNENVTMEQTNDQVAAVDIAGLAVQMQQDMPGPDEMALAVAVLKSRLDAVEEKLEMLIERLTKRMGL